MDPISNPTPTPNPVPEPVAPVTPAAPVTPSAPAAPVTPAAPAAPVAPAAPAAPVPPVTSATPAAPVIPPAPVNPVFAPTGGGLVSATDPITMPTPPKAPDPVEEELKAPFKAAEPVPGSIGSAISVPSDKKDEEPMGEPMDFSNNPAGRTPSVSFNDPAASEMANTSAPAPKKKTSKNTLIMLSVVAGLVVVALAIVLIMQLMPAN